MFKKNVTRRTALTVFAGLMLAATMGTAQAQNANPLRIILPVGPGSGVDTIVRSTQNALSRALGGQTVVIENRPGAGGVIGTQALVTSAADGYTIGVVSNNHAVNPSVYKELPYDSLGDITPITIVGGSPFVLVTNPNVPAKNAKELQALLRSKPGEINYASSGNGTIIHLAGEMFLAAADVEARHIPYKGMGPMIVDIMGGQVEMGVGAISAVLNQVKNGALHPIGVMGTARVPSLPDVPTMAEQGFTGVDVAGWFAAVGPKNMPAEQVERLHKAFVDAFNDPEVKAGFANRDDFLILNSPQEARQFFKTEQDRYADLIKKAGLSLG